MRKALAKADPVLPSIDRARAALAIAYEHRDAPATKAMLDQAEAVRVLVRRRDGSGDLYKQAAQIKVRAEWTLGRILRDMKQAGQRAAKGGSPMSRATTLVDLGITRDLAAQSQTIATLAEEELAAWLRERHEGKGDITTAAVVRLAKARSHVDQPAKPRAPAEAEPFDQEMAIFEVMGAVTSAVARWPPGVSLRPLIVTLQDYVENLKGRLA